VLSQKATRDGSPGAPLGEGIPRLLKEQCSLRHEKESGGKVSSLKRNHRDRGWKKFLTSREKEKKRTNLC